MPEETRRRLFPDVSAADRQRFWMETARILALAIAGAGVTWAIVNPLKQRDDYAAMVDGQRLTIRSKVVDDYMQSATNYSAKTHDVLMGDRDVKAWQSYLIDTYRAKGELMRLHFGPTVDKGLDEAKVHTDALWDTYKAFQVADKEGKDRPAISWGKSFDDLEAVHNRIAKDALVELTLLKAQD